MKKAAFLTTAIILGIFMVLSVAVDLSAQDYELTPDMAKLSAPVSLSEEAGFFCPDNSTIFGQRAHGPRDSWNIILSDKASNFSVYDNFTDAGNIIGIHFWGVMANTSGGWTSCPENPVNFSIAFFEDDAGEPGDLVAWRDAVISGTPTGQYYAGLELYIYEATFDEPVEIEEGWLLIYSWGGDLDCYFAWVSGYGIDSHSLQNYNGTMSDRYYDQAFCLLFEGCPEGVDVFGQPPDMSTDGFYFATSDNGMSESYCVYEYFTDLSYVSSIHFWGLQGHLNGTWEVCSEDPMTFEIKFYTDNAGTPGSLISTINKTLTGNPIGINYDIYELYEYETSFPAVPLTSGWISVQGVDLNRCWFLWLASRDGYDNQCYQWQGASLVSLSIDVSMCLLETCCAGYTGNVDCSESEIPDISDITRLIDYLYLSHNPLCCEPEADADGSGGEPDISDITRLIDFLYLSHTPLPLCY